MNKHIIIAAFTRDPELRYTGTGTAIFEGTLAGERTVIGGDGKERNIPFYDRIQAMGKYAEHLAERGYKQGTVVTADGQLDYSQWDSPEGKRSMIRTRLTGNIREAAGEFELVQDAGGGVRLKGGLNRVTLIGNVARDPEIRYTPAGDAVLSISIGVNESWKDKNGARQEKTHWVDLTLWRELAEQHKGLRKGDPIMVEGATADESWTDKDGNKRRSTKVEVDMCLPLARGNAQGQGGQGQAAPRQAAPVREPVAAAAGGQSAPARSGGLDIDQGLEDFPPMEDDLPF